MQSSDKRLLMTGTVTDLYGGWVNFLTGGDGFALSFLAGMLAIAFHARNRLQITAPLGDMYDFVRLLSLPALVGQHHFRRSYLIYVLLLEVFFVFLCLVKPLFPSIVGTQPGYEGAGWPLGAALVVVGVLPTLPWIDQIELSLRRFALSAADIPNEFFRRVARLSQSEIRRYLESDKARRQELNMYWRLHNLALFSGCTAEEANDAARRGIGLHIFTKWTVDDTSIWNEGERAKLKEVFDLLRSKTIVIKKALDDLSAETAASAIVALVAAKAGIVISSPMTSEQMLATTEISASALIEGVAGDQKLYREELPSHLTRAAAWRKLIEEMNLCNRQLCAVFATLAVNDPETTDQIINRRSAGTAGQNKDEYSNKGEDYVLREMLITLKKVSVRQPYPAYNAVAMAEIIAFILCFGLIFSYLSIWSADATRALAAPAPRQASPFEFSFFTSLNLSVTFLAAGLSALFIRRSEISRGPWQPQTSLLQLPLTQYALMLPRIMVHAFIPYVLMTIAYAYYMGDIKNLIDLNRLGTYSFVAFCLSWTLMPCVFSIGLCIIADRVEPDIGTVADTRYLSLIIVTFLCVVTFIGFLVVKTFMLLDSRYDAILWPTMLTAALHCGIASAMFTASYKQNLRLAH
ncbi:hypothetical protein [Rhizobium sp. LjRoot254]|uniref:hypothetical protein n=1 Tax=Rhizobium sp. LjRoot254 TaxID=3342297 RepID=UPI003ED03786